MIAGLRPAGSPPLNLPRRVAATIVATLLVCATAAWLFTIHQSSALAGMGGMAMLGPGLFLVTWVVMMVAMMFPSAAPMVLTHAGVVRSRGEGIVLTVTFVVGYLAVWTAAGLVVLGILQLLESSAVAPVSGWLPRLGGAVVVLAGVYQLTPLNSACLRGCRSQLDFVRAHDFGRGSPAAARAGVANGLYCLGCCWPLMAVLAVAGLMNLVLMAAFAVVFLLEKTWRQGITLSRIAGVTCVILGLAVIVRPDVLGMLAGPMA